MQPEFWDISVPLTSTMPVWPNTAGLVLSRVHDIPSGDPVNESELALGAHVGTHIDAPLHFLAGGATIDALPLDALVGPAQVVKISTPGHISASDLEASAIQSTRLLFQTSNGQRWTAGAAFDPGYVALDTSAARWVVEHGVRLVGIDYLSIEAYGGSGEVHRTLLGASVVVVEGLDLRAVTPGKYWLSCLPLRLVGAEGAPARAVLMRPAPVGVAA